MTLQVIHVVRFEYGSHDDKDLNFYAATEQLAQALWKDFPELRITTNERGYVGWGAQALVEGSDEITVLAVARTLFRRIKALPGARMLNPEEA